MALVLNSLEIPVIGNGQLNPNLCSAIFSTEYNGGFLYLRGYFYLDK